MRVQSRLLVLCLATIGGTGIIRGQDTPLLLQRPTLNRTDLAGRPTTNGWCTPSRRKVDQLSGGKVAYVHVPDTANGGYINFNRFYFAQTDKEAAVIDERYNHGG